MRSIVPALRLKFEAFRLSLLAFVSQVPVYIRLFLEIHRWPRSLLSLVRASTRRYYFTVLVVDLNTANNAILLLSALLVILAELVSILPCQKMGRKLNGARVSPTQVDSFYEFLVTDL
jgi:hypothetical protein